MYQYLGFCLFLICYLLDLHEIQLQSCIWSSFSHTVLHHPSLHQCILPTTHTHYDTPPHTHTSLACLYGGCSPSFSCRPSAVHGWDLWVIIIIITIIIFFFTTTIIITAAVKWKQKPLQMQKAQKVHFRGCVPKFLLEGSIALCPLECRCKGLPTPHRSSYPLVLQFFSL